MRTETHHEGRFPSLRVYCSSDEATPYNDRFRDHQNRPITVQVFCLEPAALRALLAEVQGNDRRLDCRPGVVVDGEVRGLDINQWYRVRRLRPGE